MVYETIQTINGGTLLGAVICALLCVGLWGKKALANERYQETQAYQEYLLLPDSYKSPQMEAKFKHSFEAERSVKNQTLHHWRNSCAVPGHNVYSKRLQ